VDGRDATSQIDGVGREGKNFGDARAAERKDQAEQADLVDAGSGSFGKLSPLGGVQIFAPAGRTIKARRCMGLHRNLG
jgi:hypothetical protein